MTQSRSIATEPDKVERVRSYFELPKNYLDERRFDIRIRTETVAAFLEGRPYGNVLDIGCGDGSISIPLLRSASHLTLVDVSPNMLACARSQVPAEAASRVECHNADFLKIDFPRHSFDVVICMGVLAHVIVPADVVARISEILKPGGTLLLECTDSFHPVGRLTVLHNTLAGMIKKSPLHLNLLSSREVLRLAQAQGFQLEGVFRYALPLFKKTGLSPDRTYAVIRGIFGHAKRNRNAWLGNQYIFCLTRGA